jgi:DNA primase
VTWHDFDDRRVDVPRLLRALGIEAVRADGALKARCPAHEDSKPSWSIVDAPGAERNGVHGCWSCGFSGRAVGLAKKVLGYATWVVAREWVEENALRQVGHSGFVIGATLLPELPPPALKVPPGVVFAPLKDWPEKPQAYARQRGMTDGQVERWRIGYAVDGHMRGRIFIPTVAEDGRLASFTGRSYIGSSVRYLTAVGPDLAVLFGESLWPERPKRNQVVVLEGALNALAVERATMLPVAAISGSHLHPLQAAKLSTFKEVTIGTDPDVAGEKAATVILAALGRHAIVKRIIFPKGKDAADMDVLELARSVKEAKVL